MDALKEVSQKSPVPIATGEKLPSIRDFKPLILTRRPSCYIFAVYISFSWFGEWK